MTINIKGTNITLTRNLKDYIRDKIGSCQKFINIKFPPEVYVEIEKTTRHHRKGKIFRAEVNMVLPKKLIRVEAKRDDIYLAINEAKDLLQRELKQYKSKY